MAPQITLTDDFGEHPDVFLEVDAGGRLSLAQRQQREHPGLAPEEGEGVTAEVALLEGDELLADARDAQLAKVDKEIEVLQQLFANETATLFSHSLDKSDNVFVLEVNPNPDLTEGVGFIASSAAAGISFSKALRMIVDEALKRGSAPDG